STPGEFSRSPSESRSCSPRLLSVSEREGEPPEHLRFAADRWARRVLLGEGAGGLDDRVEVGELATSELPGVSDRLAVFDQEHRAGGDVSHPSELRRDPERSRRLPVPVREK